MIHFPIEMEMGHSLFRIFHRFFADRNFLYFRVFWFIEKLPKILACISPIFFFATLKSFPFAVLEYSFFFFIFLNYITECYIDFNFIQKERIFSICYRLLLLLIKLLQFRGSKHIIFYYNLINYSSRFESLLCTMKKERKKTLLSKHRISTNFVFFHFQTRLCVARVWSRLITIVSKNTPRRIRILTSTLRACRTWRASLERRFNSFAKWRILGTER